ncbi:helicase [Rathayibacter sp. AY2B7]|uniref:Rv3654c family TadE-like protein n=1 Tax=unclassified Rathayibacter TaxID=2609250 RepID=UPI000CE8B777|nr:MULTISPECIES: Rv3654c family TadE-like protein [unclassified Rathayibacter]PPG10810.1 helicase [Rathayibacter sp. AY2B1]PPG62867.1 helicase [Rathayibacter sp. AY2B7]PPG71131.1 helicase [Rathayibacter sp. AY1F4]
MIRRLAGAVRDREEGSAAVVAIGVVAGTILVTAAVLAGCAGVVGHQRAVAAADASSLAAADVASGLLAGDPCGRAAAVSRANGAELVLCDVDGGVARTEAAVAAGPLSLTARSRAGPPP